MSKSLGEQEMLWEHEALVFPQLFQGLPNFNECFYNLIETWEHVFYFF